jgi:hypothetical protein
LRLFEEQYHHENDRIEETLDFMEWIGEYRLLQRLNEKAETLKGIHIEQLIPLS